MSVIVVRDLVKEFRVAEREPGLWAAARSLFHRRYKVARAVDGIGFSIERGERVGFLGRNGAGKTTTLKMLAGLLHPTSGLVEVAGFAPQRRAPLFLGKITLVLGQKQQLLWDLPPVDTFELNRAIYDLSDADYRHTLDELIELLQLGTLIKRPTRQLSLGERMKCELVAALLHRPEVLFLDEPTIGLDVPTQLALREFIRAYNERHGATVLLTSHYMADVTALCPRVLLIDQGKLTFDGELDGLVRRVRPNKRVIVRRAGLPPETFDLPHEGLSQAVAKLLAAGDVDDLVVEDPPLEEVMRDLLSS
ncbi:MAG: ATP-binding cassette domain-containing protein [Polyangia bacterium]